MKTSDTIVKLAPALVAFQGEVDPVVKGEEADTGSYKYKYADHAATIKTIQPALSANNLALTHDTEIVDKEMVLITTRLIHNSGEWMETGTPMPIKGVTPQGMGTVISYGKRYGANQILGLACVDDDAAGAEAAAKAAAEAKAKGNADAKSKAEDESKTISEAQRRLMRATQRDLKIPDGDLKTIIKDFACVDSSKDIPKAMFDGILNKMAEWKPDDDDGLPF